MRALSTVIGVVLVVGLAAAAGCGRSQAAKAAAPTDGTAAQIEGFFQNGSIKLAYHLDRPPGRAPFAAVVLGHGSGQTTKNEGQYFVSGLLARGFAVLRYDKRGVGQSTGTYSTVGTGNSEKMFADLSGDMAAGMQFLRAQPDIDKSRVGLMGASQAGWIIPLAARQADAAFMIIVSGPTVSVGEEIFFSRFSEGATPPFERAYDELSRYKGPRGFDPKPVLEVLSVPGLWLLGASDDSIPERNTVAILQTLIAQGRPFAFVEYPGAGHSLVNRVTGVPAAIWPDIDRWLKARGKS